MTTDPELDDAPLQSAVEAETAAAAEATRPPRPPLDVRVQLALGAGIAVAVIGLVGSVIGAWSLDFSGIILIAAGLVAAGAAYASISARERYPDIALRDLILAGGTIAAALGILFVAEILFDMDNLDTYGGAVGLVLTIGLGVAGVALYYAASEWWSGGPAAPWTSALAAGDRATKLVLLGAALVLIGWLGNVTIGFWLLRAGAEVITLILLAALVMRAAVDPEMPLRLPVPAAFVALALAIVGAIIAIQHTASLLDVGAGLEDWLAQLLYVAGVVLVIVGAGLASSEGVRTMTEDPSATTPSA
jgi:hypothetical protein